MRRGFKPVQAVSSALAVGGPHPVGVLCGTDEEFSAVEMVINTLGKGDRVYAKMAKRAAMPTEKELKALRDAERAEKGEDPNVWHKARREAKRGRLANG